MGSAAFSFSGLLFVLPYTHVVHFSLMYCSVSCSVCFSIYTVLLYIVICGCAAQCASPCCLCLPAGLVPPMKYRDSGVDDRCRATLQPPHTAAAVLKLSSTPPLPYPQHRHTHTHTHRLTHTARASAVHIASSPGCQSNTPSPSCTTWGLTL